MKFLLLALALVSTQAFAKDYTLKCQATYNAEKILEADVTLKQGQQNLSFGEAQGFEFFIASKGNDIVELQALNIFEPSRSYATAKLTGPTSYVELSIWNSSFIMEVRCTNL